MQHNPGHDIADPVQPSEPATVNGPVVKWDPALVTFHLVPAEEWQASDEDGPYLPVGFDRDGFVHCTDGRSEIAATGNRHLRADPRPYLALVIRRDAVRAPIRYDVPGSPYPHIYGPINREAIVTVLLMPRAADGTFLPLPCGDDLVP